MSELATDLNGAQTKQGNIPSGRSIRCFVYTLANLPNLLPWGPSVMRETATASPNNFGLRGNRTKCSDLWFDPQRWVRLPLSPFGWSRDRFALGSSYVSRGITRSIQTWPHRLLARILGFQPRERRSKLRGAIGCLF